MKKNKITLTAFVMAVLLLLGTVSAYGMSISDLDPNGKYKYIEAVHPIIKEKLSNYGWCEIHYYHEKYEYFSEENLASSDEHIPDYVLINISTNMGYNMPIADLFGDYIMDSSDGSIPFGYGLCIYIPKTQEVISLTAAYERGIEGFDKVFTEAKVGSLIGDMDNDRKLTIKDATYIQKMIAGFEGFTESEIYAAEFDETLPISISDFNRDRVRNIKDATAIQKYLAGIEE